MKTKLLLLAIVLTGCSSSSEQENAVTANKIFKVPSVDFNFSYRLCELNVIIIDSCEYLYGYVGGSGGYVLCHKGNCNNPVHWENK